MRPSYRQLISDHEQIEAEANQILVSVRDKSISAFELAASLVSLAETVESHIAVETGVISTFDDSKLTGPWVEAWHDGLTAFERLRRDWIAFLYRWNGPAIKNDRQQFQISAEAILGRLRERVQLETRAFYATALQNGAIELR